MRRCEDRSTIKLLSDVPTAGAILDGILHDVITIAIRGRSYRAKQSTVPLGGKTDTRRIFNSRRSAQSRFTLCCGYFCLANRLCFARRLGLRVEGGFRPSSVCLRSTCQLKLTLKRAVPLLNPASL